MKLVLVALLAVIASPVAAGPADDYVKKFAPTALIVLQSGHPLFEAGDTARKVNVASVRKSLLSALYGIAVAEGRIRLDSTLADLAIDDISKLTEVEKKATVRDLLTARSGIYVAAAYETADIKKKRPVRGSHAPGTRWFYNNWDFNALGTIYRKATGEDIFESFANRIARPTGMEDFTSKDGRYSFAPDSEHPAYPFFMSARDLARFGQLFLNEGRWGDRQIISAGWVRESGAPYSATPRGGRGYGYMWWVLPDAAFGPGTRMAAGYGGQFLAVVPAKRLVVVQTAADGQTTNRLRSTDFVDLVRTIASGTP